MSFKGRGRVVDGRGEGGGGGGVAGLESKNVSRGFLLRRWGKC